MTNKYLKITFLPIVVMYFGFPILRDVLPYYDGFTFEDWLALGGVYVVGALIAAPYLFRVSKHDNEWSGSKLLPSGLAIAIPVVQGSVLALFWNNSIAVYLCMAITMAFASVIVISRDKRANIIIDKDTGKFYRIKGDKAYLLSDEVAGKFSLDKMSRSFSLTEFSSSSISGFDSSSSVIPVGYASSNFEHTDSNTGLVINPSSGLPMVGGISGVDVHGNSWGTNYNEPSSSYDPNRGY